MRIGISENQNSAGILCESLVPTYRDAENFKSLVVLAEDFFVIEIPVFTGMMEGLICELYHS
jgi:hypothetical protein